VRRRKRREPSAAAVELAAYAAQCEAAAVLGDGQAAERLRAVRSWMDMLRVSGDDPDVGALFVAFVRDDWILAGLRRGAA
jgi:hypothetical protein